MSPLARAGLLESTAMAGKSVARGGKFAARSPLLTAAVNPQTQRFYAIRSRIPDGIHGPFPKTSSTETKIAVALLLVPIQDCRVCGTRPWARLGCEGRRLQGFRFSIRLEQ